MTSQLAPGDTAPAFTLSDADGGQVSLADFAGQRVIVYFYPAAMTPGCTTQAIDFTAATDSLTGAGVSVLGISPDEPSKLARFAEQEGISFPLLSDPNLETLKGWGAYGSKMLYGKDVQGVIRSTFVVDVDDEGVGSVVEARYNVRAKGHVERLLRDLGV
ncbi:thioredoxin-dependent thiol peroxidase [Desertihabitans aurantiacus]|uniref:thioredoxin-dependent thiol peroxidase n=1 Tax=Desertihabitans aurantiacus TaxID=2282477 RepID=UPI000DF81579|nr:thioredoxin-dependent thiol peroxidase [Desertihabitans aurantiacus]